MSVKKEGFVGLECELEEEARLAGLPETREGDIEFVDFLLNPSPTITILELLEGLNNNPDEILN